MLKPLPPFAHFVEDVKDSMCALQGDTLYRFAWHAQQHPSSSTGIQVRIIGCTGLSLANPDSARPYVHYQFPGYMQPVDTAVQHGQNPRFNEKRIFEFSPDPQTNPMFLSKLRETVLQLHVYDASENGSNALVGTAQVSLQCVSIP
jgi:Ca2+-dependent lipid-binding protein